MAALRLEPHFERTTPRASVSLASVRRLLTTGGDGRIALEGGRAANRYGCSPWPDAEVAAFGSATASTISELGFAAAVRLRRHLCSRLETANPAGVYAEEIARQRRELGELLGIEAGAGTEIVFAASGTDLHLIAAELVRGKGGRAPLAVMAAPAETGSGVPAALGCRHFDTCSAQGAQVVAGGPLAGGAMTVAQIAVRSGDGTPLPPAEVDAAAQALVAAAAEEGHPVLLVVTDVSKTGLIAPGPEMALTLRRRFAGQVEVLIDACQFRLAAATLRAYLAQDCLVALTGSKFVTGPAFAGALLLPPAAAGRLAARPLSPALRAYSARGDWPQGLAAAETLEDAANFGLLLRWEAALAELRAFRQVPEAAIETFLAAFAAAVRQRLESDPAFEPLPQHALDRRALMGDVRSWDQIPTLFPFLLRRPGSAGAAGAASLLDAAEMAAVHRLLAQPPHGHAAIALGGRAAGATQMRCQLGQPVACGSLDGMPLAALRLCASARLVVEATADGGSRAGVVIARALAALDRTAQAARTIAAAGSAVPPAIFS